MAGLGLGDRDAEGLTEVHDGLAGLGVAYAAARDDHGLLGRLDEADRLVDLVVVRDAAGDVMDALLEEVVREVKALALDVLGHGDDCGAAVCGVGQHAHGVDHRGHELLGARDAVPILCDRLEAVGRGHRQVAGDLELLEDRIRLTGGEGVRREEQKRQVVDGRGQRGGDHIGCADADGRRAGNDLAAVVLLGVGDGGVRHALLVAALVDAQVAGVFLQRLAQADDHAVPEDREDAVHERLLHAVKLDVLLV